MSDDDEFYPPEGGCLGFGSVSSISDGKARGRVKRRPIGFVHFPDKPEKKKRRAVKVKQKRRKR